MTPTIEQTPAAPQTDLDLVAAVHRVLAASAEPLTLSKIRSHLPTALRGIELEQLAEALARQVAANALYQYPKYRSQQDRFWDRAMPAHAAALLRQGLQDGPLAWSELRRKRLEMIWTFFADSPWFLRTYLPDAYETVIDGRPCRNRITVEKPIVVRPRRGRRRAAGATRPRREPAL